MTQESNGCNFQPVVGQTLWFVGAELGNFRTTIGNVVVSEVGRKWCTVAGVFNGRISVDNLVADGGGYSSPGRCYASRLAWLDTAGAELAWRSLRVHLLNSCPPDMSYETIVQAAKLLGVNVELPAGTP